MVELAPDLPRASRPAPPRARLRDRDGSPPRGEEAAERAPGPGLRAAGPKPTVVGEGRAARLRCAASFLAEPGDLPVLPERGTPAPPARELRSGQRVLVRAPGQRSSVAAHRPGGDRREPGRIPDLG